MIWPQAPAAPFCWSNDLVRLVREFARFRVSSEPEQLGNFMRLAYLRRWWSLLSTALHVSIACALDPIADFAFGVFPAANAIDILARDPPVKSVLGYRGLLICWKLFTCSLPFLAFLDTAFVCAMAGDILRLCKLLVQHVVKNHGPAGICT